jgi:hypothetical protein
MPTVIFMMASDKKIDSREVFQDNMARWIAKQFSAFDAIHAAGSNKGEFKDTAYAEFRKEFGGRCDAIKDCKKVCVELCVQISSTDSPTCRNSRKNLVIEPTDFAQWRSGKPPEPNPGVSPSTCCRMLQRQRHAIFSQVLTVWR